MDFVKIHKPVFFEHQPRTASWETRAWERLIFACHTFLLNKKALLAAQLVVQTILFLPLLILTIMYYHAPAGVTAAIFIAFVINVIACLDKPGERFLNSIFAFCLMDVLILFTFLI